MAVRIRRTAGVLAVVAAGIGVAGCGSDSGAGQGGHAVRERPALVGREPVPLVHLIENHSSALIHWRRADVQDRIVVHIDGHADFDWLPDETVARIAAAGLGELGQLERHPYSMDGETLRRFAIWNFIYPAARLGLVRELVWVVPDGTLTDRESAQRLVHEIIVGKLERVGLEEAAGFRFDGQVLRGVVLGVSWIVCELDDLPEIDEPVLLDIDLDYFCTRSAITQEVSERPWIDPDRVIEVLEAKRIRTDVATLSFSTTGGFLPPANRWIGKHLLHRLRQPDDPTTPAEQRRREAIEATRRGDYAAGLEILEGLTLGNPRDACAWHCMGLCLVAMGERDRGRAARERAIALDPLLGHENLFLGDRHWLNEDFENALLRYRAYLAELPVGPFTAYALRRVGGSLMRLDRDAEAIETFRKVLELAPDHADTLLDLGVLLRSKGDLEGAIEVIERARALLPERSTYALALGSTYLMAGRLDDGVRELAVAVEAKPTSVRARGNLAAGLIELGRYGEAAGHLRIALSREPYNGRIRQLAAAVTRHGVGLTDPQR